MYTAEIPAVVTVIGTVFSFLGVTGIDSSVISGAVNGLISIVTLGMALWAWYNHRQTLNSAN